MRKFYFKNLLVIIYIFQLLLSGFHGESSNSSNDTRKTKNSTSISMARQEEPISLLFENSDFELGSLKNWTASGKAFKFQPIKGDKIKMRTSGLVSANHQGDYWIGTYDKYNKAGNPGQFQTDVPTGILVSIPFTIKQEIIAFRIGGGKNEDTIYAALQVNGEEIRKSTGKNEGTMRTVRWRVGKQIGEEALIIIKDLSKNNWGHINVDNFHYENLTKQDSIKKSRWDDYGRWRKFRPNSKKGTISKKYQKEIKKLESLGYLTGSQKAPVESNVTIYHPNKCFNALNFYVSGHAAEAILMDMEGNELHSWACGYNDIWPELPRSQKNGNHQFWRRAFLFKNGDILVIFDGIGIVKLDKNSKVVWKNMNRAHHDLQVMKNGCIYTLTRKASVIPRILNNHPVLEDFLVILDKNGKEIKKISLLKALENSHYHELLPDMKNRGLKDIFHTNSIEVLDGKLAGKSSFFRAGNVLISMREIHAITILDLDTKKIVYSLTGAWRFQHHPTILPNGRMLLFDNKGKRFKSRIFELDPISKKIFWRYEGTESKRFFSNSCGSCQRLPNGNTLITESDNGRAFELTLDKTIVWEFINPHRAGDNNEFIATLFEVVRLKSDFPLDWLTD